MTTKTREAMSERDARRWFRTMERADRGDVIDAPGLFLGVLDTMDDRRAAAFRTTVTKIEGEEDR